jgi:hypothetical protein
MSCDIASYIFTCMIFFGHRSLRWIVPARSHYVGWQGIKLDIDQTYFPPFFPLPVRMKKKQYCVNEILETI